MTDTVTVTVDGHVALVVFANPPHNHVTVGVLRKLADALHRLGDAAEVRAIVLASEGTVFCAGADLVNADGFGGDGDDPLREFYDQVIRLFAATKPVVAAIQGAAIGAGLGLAAAADFRVAGPQARFSANFVKLGFHPGFGLTVVLPRLIGHQHAAEMMLTGTRYKTDEVTPWGLVDRTAGASDVRAAALRFAAEIAENAPLSLLATRATLRAGLAESVTTALVHEHHEQLKLRSTEDHAEGLKAVAERRSGRFLGR